MAHELAIMITGLDPVLVTIFGSALGTLCITIVKIIREKEKSSAGEVLGRFVVGWLSGCFLGPIIAPSFQAAVKISDGAVSFLAGASGYTFIDKVLPGKIAKMASEDKPPEPPQNEEES